MLFSCLKDDELKDSNQGLFLSDNSFRYIILCLELKSHTPTYTYMLSAKGNTLRLLTMLISGWEGHGRLKYPLDYLSLCSCSNKHSLFVVEITQTEHQQHMHSCAVLFAGSALCCVASELHTARHLVATQSKEKTYTQMDSKR